MPRGSDGRRRPDWRATRPLRAKKNARRQERGRRWLSVCTVVGEILNPFGEFSGTMQLLGHGGRHLAGFWEGLDNGSSSQPVSRLEENMEPPRKPIAFFSHSSRDKEALGRLKDLFVEKTGGTIEIFLSSDGQSIKFGRNWVHRIEEAL